MGNKTNPIAMRIGVNKDWDATWYTSKHNFASTLLQDVKIRELVADRLHNAGLARCVIRRAANKLMLELHVARPGVVIGRGGTGIQDLNNELKDLTKGDVEVKVYEVKHPEASARYVGQEIGKQLAARIAPKFAVRRLMESSKNTGVVKGIAIWVSGRIRGAEIARTEKFEWGTIPRHTLRADIDYHLHEVTVPNAGRHGIKVWIYKGEKNTVSSNQETKEK